MIIEDLDLEEDSPDLTDDDIAQAVDTPHIWGLVDQLKLLSCPSCGGRLWPTAHALRRRKPALFWRVTAACSTPGCSPPVRHFYRITGWFHP